MAAPLRLDDTVATLYAEALAAIARADREVNPEEAGQLSKVIAARTSAPMDPEVLFFARTAPEELARAVLGGGYRTSGGSGAKEVGRALIADAIEVATVDGDLNAQEGHAILRYARALGLSSADVQGVTSQLDPWLDEVA